MQHKYLLEVSVLAWKLKNILLILVLLLLTFLPKHLATVHTVQAHGDDGHSHGRFGHITWIAVDGDPANSARITFTAGFRRNAFDCSNPLTGDSIACSGADGLPSVGDVILETVGDTTINDFGDSTSIPATLYFKVFSISADDNWLMARALQPGSATQEYLLHTYPSIGPYTIVSESCCRTGALAFPNAHINNPDEGYRFTAVVDFSKTTASPISLLPPIVDCPLESVCTFKVAAVDPDATDPEDPVPSHLRWRLALPDEMGGSALSQPPGATIDAETGAYMWNTHNITLGPDGYNTLYSTQVVIEDTNAANGHPEEIKSSIVVDFFIRVIDLPGPPVDDIRIPVRWCALLESPSLSDPNQSIEEILDQRLRQLSHRIYMPQAQVSFISTPREAGYPTFANTNAHGNPGNGNFRAEFASLDLRRAISDCRLNWQATDPGAPGMIAINLRRFVDGSGQDTGSLFGVAMGPDWNERGIPGYQLVSGASVIDNTFLADPNQKWLGHEIGHAVSLTHTLDPDNPDPLQSQIVDHTGNIMNDENTIYDTIEGVQRTVIRTQALMIPGARQVGAPPPGGGTRADTVSDTPGSEGFVDVDTTGIALSPDQSTTHFVTSTYGLFPQNASGLNYYFAADLDNQSSTGGSPSSIGAPYATQGMDLVGLVQVSIVNDVPQGIPTVWKYQNDQFIQITDPRIESDINRLYGTEGFALQTITGDPTPIAEVIQLLIPSDLLGSIATEVRLATIAQNPSTSTVDSVEGPIFLTSPTFPSCQINPDGALLGSGVRINASDLLANSSIDVYLGDQVIASGSTDASGNTTLDATIPTDAITGTQMVSVHVVGTGVSAFCTVQLWATPKFDVPPSPADGTSFIVNVGETLEIPIQASDLDTEAGDVVMLDAIGLPIGADFPISTPASTASTTFSWTPTTDQIGSYIVVFTARDSLGLSATPLSITITVNAGFPSTPILDNFNRANGVIGTNWSGNKSKYGISSNQLLVNSNDSNSDIYWNSAPFGADQEVYVVFANVKETATQQSFLLKSQSNSTWGNGVLEVMYDAPGHRVQVMTWEWPAGWVQHGADIPVTFVVGDTFGARALADGTVEVYRNGELLTTRDITSWSHYADGGYVGLWFIGAKDAVLDDFGGGTVPGDIITALPTLDDFNRANGTPGSDWSGATSAYSISTNQLLVGSATYGSEMYWNTASFDADQEAHFTFSQVNTSAIAQGLTLKAQGISSGTSLLEVLYVAPLKVVQAWTYTPSQGWVQHGSDIPVIFASGDQLTARAYANGSVEVYKNGVLFGRRDITAWPHYASGGYIGVGFVNASGAKVDDFGGGTLSGGEGLMGMSASNPLSEGSEFAFASDSFDVNLDSADIFWQGVPLGLEQEAVVRFAQLNKTTIRQKPESNGIWGEDVVQVLYDLPNQRIQVWVYDSEQGWVQQGKNIPVKFVDGDEFSVRVEKEDTVEIYRNGKLLVKRNVMP